MTTTTDPQRVLPTTRTHRDPGWGYGSLWRRVPGTALYAVLRFVLAVIGIALLPALFFAGVGTIVIVIGLPLVVLSLLAARVLGDADRHLLVLTGLPPVPAPEWHRHPAPHTTRWSAFIAPLRNPHSWTSLLHGSLVGIVVGAVSFGVVVAWLSAGLGGLTYWFWSAFIPTDEEGEWGRYVAEAIPWLFGGWSAEAVQNVLTLLVGILFTATMPWVFGGIARMHHGIASALVGRWESDDLATELRAEAAARDAALHAEDEGLRRLERDLHDGPQQRLVRLQFDLAALERRAASGDAESAARLAQEARAHAQLTLDELRALSAGVAPPLLQDRGLSAALVGLGETSPLDVRVELAPALDESVRADVARTVYFIAAELLANAAKHSGARGVTLRAWTDEDRLELWVVDDGQGGAVLSTGHGLAGLKERAAGLRGSLSIDSPAGGPTRIGVQVPLASDARSVS